MLIHLLTGQVLAFGFDFNIKLRSKLSDPVVAGLVPHQVRMGSKFLLFVSGGKECGKIGLDSGIMSDNTVLTTNTVV
jgi:hypothetical protein